MNIAFWSEEDGCGTTSGMAAIASICSNAWNIETVFMQSESCEKSLYRKEESLHRRAERLYRKPKSLYRETERKALPGMMLEQNACFEALTFIDCGSGENEASEELLRKADVIVINLLQERHSLDAYFQKRHAFRGRVIYLLNQYQQESVYNRKNIHRLYRLQEEELCVILHNSLFRHFSDRGEVNLFIRSYIRCSPSSHQFCFIQELMRTAYLILKAVGLEEAVQSAGQCC